MRLAPDWWVGPRDHVRFTPNSDRKSGHRNAGGHSGFTGRGTFEIPTKLSKRLAAENIRAAMVPLAPTYFKETNLPAPSRGRGSAFFRAPPAPLDYAQSPAVTARALAQRPVSRHGRTKKHHQNWHPTQRDRSGLRGISARHLGEKCLQTVIMWEREGEAGIALYGLQNRCSTTELTRHYGTSKHIWPKLPPGEFIYTAAESSRA